MSFAEWRTRVDELARVDEKIVNRAEGDARDRCILEAVSRYSKERPRSWTVACASTGAFEYDLSAAVGFTWNRSCAITRILYPGDARLAREVDDNDWLIRRKPDGKWYLVFTGDIPSGGSDLWLELQGPHQLSAGATEDLDVDTLRDESPDDVDAVCHLAVSIVLDIAAKYFADKSTSVEAETGDYQTYSSAYAKRAAEELKSYRAAMDGGDDAEAPASAMVDWDTRSYTGFPFLGWRPELS